MYLHKGVTLQPQEAVEFGNFDHGVLSLESRIEERHDVISLHG